MDLQIPIIDLAAEVEVSTTRAKGAGRKRKSASNIKDASKKSKPNTRSKVTEGSEKGAKKALGTAIIDDAENIQRSLPTEALPAPSKVKTRKALTKSEKKSVYDSILGTKKEDLVPFVLLDVDEELHIHTYQERAEF